jgi:UDP-3-O-[3-hydroxymyristoyl] N-acetylglucosamine deacetylase
MLDAMGDLALAGGPLLGSYRSVRGGHRLNARVVQALLADTDAWTMVRAPWVRDTIPVDVSVGATAVNYAADRT